MQTLVDTKHYDLVVTDLRMPDGHGHRLCSNLLEHKERPVVVVLTGVIEPRLADDLRARGIDAIFFKPVNFEEFAEQVQRLMHKHTAAWSVRTVPSPRPKSSRAPALPSRRSRRPKGRHPQPAR